MTYAIPLYDALVGANVAPDKAKRVVEAFEKEHDSMNQTLATKADLQALRGDMQARFDAESALSQSRFDKVASDMALLESRMTVKLGTMMAAMVGLGVALMKAIP